MKVTINNNVKMVPFADLNGGDLFWATPINERLLFMKLTKPVKWVNDIDCPRQAVCVTTGDTWSFGDPDSMMVEVCNAELVIK